MKKFFALVLALVLALSLTTMAWGVTIDTATATGTRDGASYNVGVQLADGATYDGADYDGVLEFTDVPATPTGNEWDTAIEMLGSGTVKNVFIDCATRGIVCWSNGATVNLENVVIVNSNRPVNFTSTTPATLNVSDSTFGGRFSYQLSGGTATFTNCTFVNMGDALKKSSSVSAYDNAVFNNCVFEDGYKIDLEDFNGTTITMKDCVYAGEPLTETNMAELFDNYNVTQPTLTVANSAGAKVTFHAADGSTDGWYLLDIFAGADLDDFVADDDNFLPCYEVPGYGYFTEVKAAAGAYKLVYGAKTVYLAPVDYTKVHFYAKASVLKVVDADDAECGDWFVTNLDEDDVYYAVYDKKTGMVDEVFVAEKNGPEQLLVNGKIVDVDYLTYGTDIEWMLHDYKGYDVVNYAYTTVKCAECGKVAKLYANATAATISKKEPVKIDDLGWVTAADFYGFGAVSAPSTGKVESAQTFDAGIAMYVGMSVMAAAGGAVVIGKKKD